MILVLSQTLGSGSPRAYAASMAGLWIDLSRALARLDAVSARPESLQEGHDHLSGLQYELHCAAELVAGMTPPEGSELVHEELGDALMDAREATAEIAEALAAGGPDAAAPLVWEWRGALFRVRYARLRLRTAAPRGARGRCRRRTPAPLDVPVDRLRGRARFAVRPFCRAARPLAPRRVHARGNDRRLDSPPPVTGNASRTFTFCKRYVWGQERDGGDKWRDSGSRTGPCRGRRPVSGAAPGASSSGRSTRSRGLSR